MTKADMAKLPGLFQREGVYQLRVVIPLDLQGAYKGRTKLVQSLNTTSHREAALRATQERAKRLEEFHHKRQSLQPQRLDTDKKLESIYRNFTRVRIPLAKFEPAGKHRETDGHLALPVLRPCILFGRIRHQPASMSRRAEHNLSLLAVLSCPGFPRQVPVLSG